MGWEHRKGKGHYYVRKCRVKRQVLSHYIGTGLLGELAAAEGARRRVEREAAAKALKAERDRVETATMPLTEFFRVSDLLIQAALIQAGFYQHNRGEWRKRRCEKENSSN